MVSFHQQFFSPSSQLNLLRSTPGVRLFKTSMYSRRQIGKIETIHKIYTLKYRKLPKVLSLFTFRVHLWAS